MSKQNTRQYPIASAAGWLRLLLAAALLMLLSACATSRAVIAMDHSVAKSNRDMVEANVPRQESGFFKSDASFYAASKPLETVPVNPNDALPPSLLRSANVAVRQRISLAELMASVSEGSHVRIVVSQDVYKDAPSSGAPQGLASGATAPKGAPAGLPPLPNDAATPPGSIPQGLPAAALSGVATGTDLDGLTYSGTIAGLLDNVTGRMGISWRWNASTGQVEIFRYETRVFRLAAIAGATNSSATLSTTAQAAGGGASGGGGGGGGSSGGGGSGGGGGITGSSGQNTSVESKMEIWGDVERAIKASMSSGGTYSMVPSAGLITVHDTPTVLDEISAELGEFNKVFNRSVMLRVDVYSVEDNRSDSAGLDWSIFYNNAAKFGLRLFSSGADSNGGGNVSFTKTNGRFSANAVFQALSTMGNTALVTSASLISLNGQSVPLNVSREQAYLASSSSTTNQGVSGASTTTLTPGVVTEGFSMSFTPRILGNNEVMMRYSIDLSNIEQITTLTSPDGNTSIQLPSRSVRDFLQNVSVHSGESVMLTGFQQVQGSENSQAPFAPHAWILGGSTSTNAVNRSLVIVVTPYILKN